MASNDKQQIYKKRYKVDKKLGTGNSGTTYLVFDLEAKNELKVLKLVRLGEMDSEQTVDSVREAELLSHLDNEHIVKFYENFLENDCLCIVTEFCEGGDLDQRLKELKKQNQALEEDQVVEWLIQILIAVQHMHKSRILHRDLKARNIFLKSNQIKIGDFGMTSIYVGLMDQVKKFTGTPYYMSPEVMKHDGYEAKSDIWSVGCLLYEMCTYQHAFEGKGLINIISKVVEGKPPELPKIYSKQLNDLLKKMFMKDPKNRPSAAQLLETSFIIRHRERTKLTGPLENTISGNRRSKDISARLQVPISYGQMQKQSWSISSKDHIADDSNYGQTDNTPFDQLNEEEEEEEEEEQTLKSGNIFKSARKLHETDGRGQATRSNAVETNQNRQMPRENNTIGPSRQPRSSANDVEQARNPKQFSNEAKVTVARNAPVHGGNDDRPIIPMRTSYRQVADAFGDEDDSQYDDHSPTRERRSNESTLQSQRTMSASKRSTMNSMSRTIDPRYAANFNQQSKKMSPSRTIGSATRERTSLNTSINDDCAMLKNDPTHDPFGPIAREKKIDALRIKAIQLLGESTYEKVYDYLVKQRIAQKTDPNLDDAKITHGLAAFSGKPGDYYHVDQLVFLEMMSI